MKKIILAVVLFLSFNLITKGQASSPANTGNEFNSGSNSDTLSDHEFYLQKSKTQKVVAWVFLGSGATMLAVAAKGNTSFNSLGVIIVAGALATITSGILFHSAAKNKRAAKLAMTAQKTVIGLPIPAGKNITWLTLSIPIGR